MLCTQFYITFMLYNIIIICHMSQFNLCVKNSLSTWKIISKTTCTSTNLLQQSLFTKLENFNTQTFVTKNVGSLLYIVPYHNYNRQTTSIRSGCSYILVWTSYVFYVLSVGIVCCSTAQGRILKVYLGLRGADLLYFKGYRGSFTIQVVWD